MQLKLLSKTIIIAALLASLLSVGVANAAQVGPLTETPQATPGVTHGQLAAYLYIYYDDQTYIINWGDSTCDPTYAPGLGSFTQDTRRDVENPVNCEAYISGSFDPWFADDWNGHVWAYAYPSYTADPSYSESYWTWS